MTMPMSGLTNDALAATIPGLWPLISWTKKRCRQGRARRIFLRMLCGSLKSPTKNVRPLVRKILASNSVAVVLPWLPVAATKVVLKKRDRQKRAMPGPPASQRFRKRVSVSRELINLEKRDIGLDRFQWHEKRPKAVDFRCLYIDDLIGNSVALEQPQSICRFTGDE